MHEGVARAFSSLSTLLSGVEQRMEALVTFYMYLHACSRFGRVLKTLSAPERKVHPASQNAVNDGDGVYLRY
jgi:hypothetical protein